MIFRTINPRRDSIGCEPRLSLGTASARTAPTASALHSLTTSLSLIFLLSQSRYNTRERVQYKITHSRNKGGGPICCFPRWRRRRISALLNHREINYTWSGFGRDLFRPRKTCPRHFQNWEIWCRKAKSNSRQFFSWKRDLLWQLVFDVGKNQLCKVCSIL